MNQLTVVQALAVAIEHHNARRFDRAESLYRQILEQHPDHADALHLLGVLTYQCHNHQQARKLILQAIALHPNEAIFHCNLGEVYRALNQPEQAAQEYRRAIALNPKYADAYSNLSIALFDLHQFEEAKSVCCKAISLQPRFAKAYNNLGISLQHSGEDRLALEAYRNALSMEPEFPDAHRNFALLLLLLGDLERGFQEYEWRLKCTEFGHPVRVYREPLWEGEDLAGKTLLLHTEQGFGDAIQFIRYVPMVAARGAKIVLECQPSLVRLFESMPGVSAVVAYDAQLPPFDYQLPFLSLPQRFSTTLATIPNEVPYLSVSGELLAEWKPRVEENSSVEPRTMRIGLAWAGSPSHRDDRNRSIPLAAFGPLMEVPNTSFISLQKGVAVQQLAGAGLPIADLSAHLKDFADTAALLSQLDLVISVDTSVAHLAGALAKPVWTLIPCTTDWRWMRERQDSPWYPTMRLFRQPLLGNWPPAIAQVASALQAQVAAGSS